MDGMEASTIILYMIGACAAIMLLLVFARPARALLKGLARGGVCMLLVFLVNTLGGSAGAIVGINAFTAVFTGILGLPGLLTLYAVGLFL